MEEIKIVIVTDGGMVQTVYVNGEARGKVNVITADLDLAPDSDHNITYLDLPYGIDNTERVRASLTEEQVQVNDDLVNQVYDLHDKMLQE